MYGRSPLCTYDWGGGGTGNEHARPRFIPSRSGNGTRLIPQINESSTNSNSVSSQVIVKLGRSEATVFEDI